MTNVFFLLIISFIKMFSVIEKRIFNAKTSYTDYLTVLQYLIDFFPLFILPTFSLLVLYLEIHVVHDTPYHGLISKSETVTEILPFKEILFLT